MRVIELTKGKAAVVSDHWYDELARESWHARHKGGKWYAAGHVSRGGRRECVYMHRVIAGATRGVEVDHIDGDGLNNLVENLRLVTRGQNQRNRAKNRKSSSRFKGVSRHQYGGWKAQIRPPGGRPLYLGYFDGEVEAALAYDAAARRLFGEFACVNFPLPGEQSALRGADRQECAA